MYPFLIEISFSETKNPVNLLFLSVPWIKGRMASLWDSIAVSNTVANPSSPSLSRWYSWPYQSSCRYCLCLITLCSLVPSTSSPSILTCLSRTGHPFHMTPLLYSYPTGHLTVQLKDPWHWPFAAFMSAVPLAWDIFPSFWHKGWTQDTVPSKSLSWLLSSSWLPLPLNSHRHWRT